MLWLHNHVKPPTLPLSPTINLFQPIFFFLFACFFLLNTFFSSSFSLAGFGDLKDSLFFFFETTLMPVCMCAIPQKDLKIHIYIYISTSFLPLLLFFLLLLDDDDDTLSFYYCLTVSYNTIISSSSHVCFPLLFRSRFFFLFFSFFGTHLISKASVMFFCLRDGAHTRIHTHTPRLLRLAIGS